MTAQATFLPPLERSKWMRFLTVFLFYVTQGFPLGLFFYAIPAYMASSGASTTEIASVVGLSNLPWTLKLVNGFLMDRYTFLPMGRRRVWLLGAQGTLVTMCIVGALLAPGGRDVLLLSALGFVINSATTFQDVAIDGMVVDIMGEDEQARAGGIMFGAQGFGRATAVALSGWLIQHYGISAAYLAMAGILSTVFVYGLVIREREGERLLPWSHGQAHPRNLAIQVEAWWPLLKKSFAAMIVPASLLFIPILLMRSMPTGGFEAYWPVMTSELGEWSTTDYTNVVAIEEYVLAAFGLLVGGWGIDKIGPKKSLLAVMTLYIAGFVGMNLLVDEWSANWLLVGMIWYFNFCSLMYAISMIPLAMSLCRPEVAATQFTLYMAVGNFGAPLGASLVAATAGAGEPILWFGVLATIIAFGFIIVLITRFPKGHSAVVDHEVPQGAGMAPLTD
ncbi:MFS transporter [Altererythrobacter salegens]|uniref:MFS transporter n=1 Tax=Croceibacterium salegens TaxID=1737568 RepID=A0A6I4SSC2_9SPHN|nr:MFS transporter [Croceibacterium salegens]MXO58745.1 MFS transporter [Croceibacterium salegens]